MRPKEIKAKLDELGIQQIDLAKRWRLTGSAINKFVNKQATSARLEKNFARLFGMTVEEFRGDGQPQERKSA